MLHTSDWHIGRTFHGHSIDDHVRIVLKAISDAVREHGVDLVIVAGDVFDSSTPKADAFTMFGDAVRAIREAGAQIVVTSGNHDGPARLGHMAEFASFGGVHVRTRLDALAEPVILADEHGDVAIYGIPYLHPEFLQTAHDNYDGTTHATALDFAMGLIRADAGARDVRYVAAAHCFAQNVYATVEDSGASEERDITRGTLDLVPVAVFEGPDYVALGHIHGRATLAETVRYSGAPLRFSFGGRNEPRGMWLVNLGAPGTTADSTWIDLPVPRGVSRLTGTLDELLAPGAHEEARDDWVEIILTDDTMPLDPMRRAQAKFPHAVTVTHRPTDRPDTAVRTYAARVVGRSDTEIIGEFLAFVRGGEGPSEAEGALVAEALAALDAKESAR